MNLYSGVNCEDLENRIKADQPDFIKPMLATLTKDYFSNENWIYEHKFDGERCLVYKKNGLVTLKTRNNKIINHVYPELVSALVNQKRDNFIIDGEIIAKNDKGVSDFELLQARMNLSNPSKIDLMQQSLEIYYNIFDVIYAESYDLRKLTLCSRKLILNKLLNYNKILVYSEYKEGDGLNFFKHACKEKWEGLIAKKYDSAYFGARSNNWLKFKCVMEQELVIGGYTNPKGLRPFFGALLVGYYDQGKLMYAGKVGIGFSEYDLKLLDQKLKKITAKSSPFYNYDETIAEVNWVKPVLVGEFKFANWTNKGKLRVGSYKGLRDDKDAKEVVRELAK